MRPGEILLSIANLLVFAVLVAPSLRERRLARHLAIAPLVVAAAQVAVEGPRWQMYPAYVLSLAALLFVLPARRRSPGRSGGRAWGIRLAAGSAIVVGLLGLGASIALPIVLPVFQLPDPTGNYAIGTVTYHWTDATRQEILNPDPNDHRELIAQVWYPAKEEPSPRAPYLQDPEALASSARLLHLPGFIFDHFRYVATHAVTSAPVADGQASYPVLIFLSGRGGYRQSNMFQVEELVSHGYVVVGVDQPYAAAGVVFPDGRLIPMDRRMYDPEHPGHAPILDCVIPFLAQDVSFTLDQVAALNRADPDGILTGRLDLQREGIFGVSLGGIETGEACKLDSRLGACLVMDAFMPADVVQSGLRQPTMWISRDAQTMKQEGWTQADIEETQSTMREVYQSLPGDGYLVLIPGAVHTDFTDAPLFTPLASLVSLSGPIGGQRVHGIVNAYTLAFFDQHLRGESESLLAGPAEQFRDVIFETRHNSP